MEIKDKIIDENLGWQRINEDVIRSMDAPGKYYWITFAVCIAMVLCAVAAEIYQYRMGMGTVGLNNPHMWDMYIATFVFWIGMSHAGTLLSAILHIIHAQWRKPIYRFAEAMTTFSLMTAGFFPMIHLGRVWNLYWVLPYVSDRGIWPNFRSPLVWDAFAISTYLSASALFLVIGMIPDMAILRDHAKGWRRKAYGILALGWRGDDRQWRVFRKTYMLMACFLIPLAVSVHSIVSSDFAMSIMPGWHVTTFPPYFVAGALYSGCAAIMTLFIILRYFFRMEEYMTLNIMEKTCKLTFAIAMVWSYLNIIEFASTWYGHNTYDKELLINKANGPYAHIFWLMLFCGSVAPFALAFQKLRRHMPTMFAVSLILQLGMFVERWMIVAPTLSMAHNPHQWDVLYGSIIEWAIVFGSFGWFSLLFLVFVKLFPSVSMYEVKELTFHLKHEMEEEKEAAATSSKSKAGAVGKPGLEGA
ncbi:MAG: polysulfide reductase NrfD [Gammaproteobacteria bacterium]|nr:polysulfide reductase NrfD [Gammaproteobacteria bacterium]MDH5730665.1 polysulfide reductase NrfD [Gammaproteobacteria bacterium]